MGVSSECLLTYTDGTTLFFPPDSVDICNICSSRLLSSGANAHVRKNGQEQDAHTAIIPESVIATNILLTTLVVATCLHCSGIFDQNYITLFHFRYWDPGFDSSGHPNCGVGNHLTTWT
jgi:hypothetical protein